MSLPQQGEYIDIHSHHAKPVKGIFTVENIMAHENLQPDDISRGMYISFWFDFVYWSGKIILSVL